MEGRELECGGGAGTAGAKVGCKEARVASGEPVAQGGQVVRAELGSVAGLDVGDPDLAPGPCLPWWHCQLLCTGRACPSLGSP